MTQIYDVCVSRIVTDFLLTVVISFAVNETGKSYQISNFILYFLWVDTRK